MPSLRTAPDLRYTDRDVREDPSLKNLVVDYLLFYGGEFDPLVRAQNMLAMDGDLTTLMTRTVLNCMRADANVASLLPAPRGYVLAAPLDRYTPASNPKTRERQFRQVAMHLRYDFVINLHKQAKWYHQIDHSQTWGHFYPAGWGDRFPADTILLWHVRAVCGKDLHANRWEQQPHIVLGDQIDAEDSGNLWCPRCQHERRDAGWKP